ncbi:4507_t:CDS:10, partial [Entrophospora sp. SA101]
MLEVAITIGEDNNFEDLLFETIGYSTEQMVIAKFYNPLTKNWTNVRDFSTKLSLCKTFNPCQVQFTLEDFESDKLYNNLNNVLEQLSLGWINRFHESIGKFFTNSLANLLCHHKKEQLKSDKLENFVKAIGSSISQPWASKDIWEEFIGIVFDLCHIVREYVKYLNSVNNQMKDIHSISCLLEHSDNYELHFLDNYLPKKAKHRFNFIKEMILRVPFTLYHYNHGNYLGTLNFIWKIPEDMLARDKSSELQMITLAMLNVLYQDLAGDSSTPPNEISKEVKERIHVMLDIQDAEIVFDLHVNNGLKGTEFDIFWNELYEYFNEFIPSVHDRSKKWTLFPNIYIPSDEYIHLQFWPGNPFANSAIIYTGRTIYSEIPEMLLLYTDGSPDHRTIFGSVQISLICLFLQGDFDFFASEYLKKKNEMDEVLENNLKGKNTLEEIRTSAKKNNLLKIGIKESIKPVQDLLNERTKRLSLNKKNFIIKRPAFRIEIDQIFQNIHKIDSTLTPDKTSAYVLQKHDSLQLFLKSHCHIRTSSFQVCFNN